MMQCPYSYFDYCAQEGETFESIAKKFSVSEKEIKNSNDISNITKGAALKIPCKCGGCARGSFYTVKKGDTLFKIAKRHDITLDVLLGANPYLNPSYYIPGQIIIIPHGSHKTSDESYILKENEGLFDVLRKYNMDVTTFCALNPGISPLDVKPGQKVNIERKMPRHAGGELYTIEKGEDVVCVAGKFGIKVSALLAANENVRPSEFTEGTCIRIPANKAHKY